MPLWLQHALVVTLVGGCAAFVAVQGYRSLLGKRSKLGSCCAKGCGDAAKAGDAAPKPAERVVFFPADMLTGSRDRRH